MKFTDAQRLISKPKGFRVTWEKLERGAFYSDYTPEKGETPFSGVGEAWAFAEKMAAALDKNVYFNIFVIDAESFQPVSNYQTRILNPYLPKGD